MVLSCRVNAQDRPAETKPDLRLEIAHILLIDVVGYSKLLVNEQIEVLQELNRIVRNTKSFRAAEANNKLIRVPTGDGMALFFSAARRSRSNVHWRLAGPCDPATAGRRFRFGWESTAVQSIESAMLTTKRT